MKPAGAPWLEVQPHEAEQIKEVLDNHFTRMSPQPILPNWRQRTIYLAGPITGYDMDERQATFWRKANELRGQGHIVVNPFEIHPQGITWIDALRCDLRAMMDCDTIYLQRGWEKSSGVRLELNVALSLNFDVLVEV